MKSKSKDKPVIPVKGVLREASEPYVYPKSSGKYNIHADDGFYDRGLDEHGMEIEYIPLPGDLPPSLRKRAKEKKNK